MTRVRVPLADVRISEGGGEPTVYPLQGEVFAEVPEEELPRFLHLVSGSEVVAETQAAKPAAKEAK